MSLDLGSPAIEIAVALSFVFFLLSLIVSGVAELIAGALKWRAKMLEDGIRGMLGAEPVADAVLAHPLVKADLKAPKKKPSYVSPRNFTLAFLDVISAGAVGPGREAEAVRSKIAGIGKDSDLGAQLRALLGEVGPDGAKLRKAIEDWFDDSMDRVSGWYKRKSLWVTIGIAVFVTLVLNVSTVRIVERLAAEPTVRAAVVTQGEAALKAAEPPATTADLEAGTAATASGKGVEATFKELKALKLPILWDGDNRPQTDSEWLIALAGWLITIVAISLGAPFWFDALGRFANLRAAGKKPESADPKK